MSDLTPLEESLLDFEKFCPAHLYIINKQGKAVPFIWNNVQRLFYQQAIKPALDAHLPVRARVLKARQMGLSTLIEAFGFWYTYTTAGQSGAVMAHQKDSASNLYEMYKTYYNYLDPAMQIGLEHSNKKELKFKVLKSGMRIYTAETREATARSSTLQFLHTSETAFYADAEATLTALLQALADTGHWLDESTANGVGGAFYNEWKASEAGQNDMIPCFYAWHQHEEYTRKFYSLKDKERFADSLTQEELKEQKAYNLTLEQLNWRRYTINNKCQRDEDIFRQEYPSNSDEAFLTSGRPVFDLKYCQEQYKRCESIEPVRFRLELQEGNKVIAIPHDKGLWQMFKPFHVKDGEYHRFAVGTDVAEGLEQGDYSSIDVYDRISGEFVLKLHAHIDPDELATQQYLLHLWLKGSAWFCTERNNQGLVTVINAFKLGVNQFGTVEFGKGMDEISHEQLGFRTTITSRPILLGQIIEAMRDQVIKDDDKHFWSEARTFVRNEKGKMQAQDKDKNPGIKCYDDRVFSKALAIHCHKWMAPYAYIKESREKQELRAYNEWMKRNRMRVSKQIDYARY